MNKFIFFIGFYLTKNKIIKKFILHNKSLFKLNKKHTKNLILVEFNGWSLQHIIISYIGNLLALKYSANIHAYPGYVLNKYTLDWKSKIKFCFSNLIPIKQFLIFASFGTKRFFYPKINKLEKNLCLIIFKKQIKKLKKLDDICKISIDRVPIGDLIYDSYLKFYNVPTINLSDTKFKDFLLESIKSFLFWRQYLKRKSVKAIIITHTVYLGAMVARIAVYKYSDIKVISGNSNGVFKFNKNYQYPFVNFCKIKKDFKKLAKFEKIEGIKLAKKRIKQRLSGLDISDLNSAKKSPYNNKLLKRVIKKNSKIKILIAAHCFLDSPHIFGNFFFPDFLEWLNFLGNISKKTDYDWYIKSHPNFNRITHQILKEFVKKNKNFSLLPLNYSHQQIIREKINYALTVYGTIGWEYAYKGIPVINATINHPHRSYSFNINPKSLPEYKNILLNLKKNKLKINYSEIDEYYFTAYIYHVVDWCFQDQVLIKKALTNFKKSFEYNTYNNWLRFFNKNKHMKILNSINRFVHSNENKILQEHCGYDLINDIIKKERFTPQT
jgi:hypothetical protein